jgi:hypothetical protein
MPEENEIIMRLGNLPKFEEQFGFAAADPSQIQVLIHGEPAPRLKKEEVAERLEKEKVKDERSIGFKAHSGHAGEPLQIVLTTNSDEIVAILNYRWDEKVRKWQPDPDDDDATDDGLSPVVKAIDKVVAAIEGLKGKTPPPPAGEAATTTAGGTATAPAGEATTTSAGEATTTPAGEATTTPAGEVATTPAGEAATTPAGGTDKKRTRPTR